jgi:hypothetical protein
MDQWLKKWKILEAHQIGLRLGIEMLNFDVVKKNLNLK